RGYTLDASATERSKARSASAVAVRRPLPRWPHHPCAWDRALARMAECALASSGGSAKGCVAGMLVDGCSRFGVRLAVRLGGGWVRERNRWDRGDERGRDSDLDHGHPHG